MQYPRPELLAAVNKFVKHNLDNGEFNKIFEKWLHMPLPETVAQASGRLRAGPAMPVAPPPGEAAAAR